MSIVVFAGPSTHGVDKSRFDTLTWHGPAVAGDVYRAARNGADAIGLIDGGFEQGPAVWHKEILWALSKGVHVLGAASIGALRAAESDVFGMVGVGRIYDEYRNRRLVDDDEVALIHGPEGLDYVPKSEPVVNVRVTLDAAAQTSLITAEEASAILDLARSFLYKDLRWERLCERAREDVRTANAAARLQDWLPEGRRDQKRQDEVDLLEHLSLLQQAAPGPYVPTFDFVPAFHWNRAIAAFEREEDQFEGFDARVLDELRLQPELYAATLIKAYAKRRPNPKSPTRNPKPEETAIQVERFRMEQGLFSARDFAGWLRRNALEELELIQVLTDHAALMDELNAVAPSLAADLIAELKLNLNYEVLAERAEAKRAALDGAEEADEEGDDTRSLRALVEWFYEERLHRTVPDDLEKVVRDFGFSNSKSPYRLLANEYRFSLIKKTLGRDAQGGMHQAMPRHKIREGTRFGLYPQAPFSSARMPLETVVLSPPAGTVGPGPTDHNIRTLIPVGKHTPYGIAGEWFYLPPWRGPVAAPAIPDPDGHFDHLEPGSPQFEAAHLHGCVRFVLDVWEGYLGAALPWHFEHVYDKLELSVIRNWANAHMGFGYLETGEIRSNRSEILPYALNFDVIAHEIGHAIMLSLLGTPDPEEVSGEFQAFHEACSDLVAMIAALHFDSVLVEVLDNTGGNLDSFNRLSRFAEISHTRQIRLANNTRTMRDYADGWTDEHNLAKPLIGALFDILIDVYHDLLVERGLIPRELEDLADIAERDPRALQQVQAGFDRAYGRAPKAFRLVLQEARDIVAGYLVELWSRIDPSAPLFQQLPDSMAGAESDVTGRVFADHIHGNLAFRGIGMVLPGPRLRPPGPDSHAHSSRMLLL